MYQVTIIIPTYNAEKSLQKLLESIVEYSCVEYELLIIDSSSTDKTIEIAKKYTDKIIIILQNEFDHGGTRTKVAQLAQSDILIYMTQDILLSDEYSIMEMINIMEDESIGAAFGRQLSYSDTNLFGKHLREFNYPASASVRALEDKKKYGLKTAFLSDSFAVYRRSALEKIGYFKDQLILGEDTYAGTKLLLAGYKLAYVAEACVYHSHSYTVIEEFKRYFDIGVFHKCEKWILEEFGKAEGEGMKYIRSELKYLFIHKAWYRVPEFFIRNGMKYLGYKMGQNYQKLPMWLIIKISMHHQWWKNRYDRKEI